MASTVKRGFSLAETIVSLGILAGLLLVVTALLISLLRGAQEASDKAAGTILAERVILERLQRIFSGLDPSLSKQEFFDSDSPPQAPLEGKVKLNQAIFNYRITYRTVEKGGTPIGGDSSSTNRLKKVDAVVWWWMENSDQQRQGYGELRTEITRLVNEKTDLEP